MLDDKYKNVIFFQETDSTISLNIIKHNNLELLDSKSKNNLEQRFFTYVNKCNHPLWSVFIATVLSMNIPISFLKAIIS